MTLPTLLRTSCALAAVSGLLTLAGCTPAPPSTPTASSTPNPTPSATTPTLSPEDQQLEAAKGRVVTLWADLDRLLTDPTSQINDLNPIVGGDALTAIQILVNNVRSSGVTQSGRTVVTSQSAVAKGDGWVVTSCIDRSDAKLLEKDGKPVTPAPAPRLSRENTVRVVGGYLKVMEDKELGSC